MAFDITDEVFAISIARPGFLNPYYTYGAMTTTMPLWAIGTALGVIAGNMLPIRLVSAFSVALYGMFLAVIIPPARKDKIIAGIIVICFALSFASCYIPFIKDMSDAITTDGFTLVTSIADSTRGMSVGEHITAGRVVIKDAAPLSLSKGAEPLLLSSASAICQSEGATSDTSGSYTIAATGTLASESAEANMFVISSVYLSAADAVITAGYSNKDFIYSNSIHVHNLKSETVPIYIISCLRDTAKFIHYKTTDGVIVIIAP